jgi:hypothetical protein
MDEDSIAHDSSEERFVRETSAIARSTKSFVFVGVVRALAVTAN